MPAKTTTHPTSEQLANFGLGRLDLRTHLEVESHVASCDRCCQALRQVPDDTLLGRLKQADTSPDSTLFDLGQGHAEATPEVPPELADHLRYRIVKLMGVGGMGEVFEAVQKLMDRRVAIKVIRRSLLDRPQALERFLLEMKAAGRLSHQNIVSAIDADHAGDLHFLVTEFVEGMSLARLVEKHGARPVVHACNYVRQAALGLQHAFEKGMVHRDIKPQNLMLTPKGQVKILDFGLARFARESEPNTASPADAETQAGGLTAMGTVLGTPDYMAPEQTTDSHKADIRADIYSLGCTLYFLLAGSPPFPSGTIVQKLKLHRSHTPRALTELRDDLPLELLTILDKMLTKDPRDRYQTPAEVAQALVSLARPSTTTEPPPIQAEQPRSEPDLANILDLPVTNLPPPANYEWNPWPQASRRRKRPLGFKPRSLAIGFTALLAASLLVAYLMSLGVPGTPPTSNAGTQPRQTSKDPAPPPAPQKPAARVGPRILFVLASQKFWYQDYEPVRTYLEQQGARVVVASTASVAQPDPTGGGEPVAVDVQLDQARAADYDAIIFCGGFGVWEFSNGERARTTRSLIEEMLAKNKIVSALCLGPVVLGNMNVLNGVRVTSYPPAAGKLEEKGAEWVDEPVVVSGRIITGRKPEDAPEFARVLWQQLQKSR